MRGVRFEEWLAGALVAAYGLLVLTGLVEPRLLSYFSLKGLQVLGVLAALVLARSLLRGRRAGLAGRALARRAASDVGGFVRDWIPWVVLISVYENSLALTAANTERLHDLRMFRLDEILFGGHVDLWLQRVTTERLTEVVAFFYDSLFLYTVGLGGLLYLLGRHAEFRRYIVAFLVAGYLGYGLYFLFPVVGPYYYFEELYTVDLWGRVDSMRREGLRAAGAPDASHVFYEIARRISAKTSYAGTVPRNCFPSLHTAWGLIILVHAWRSSRWLFALLLGPVAMMLFGTVYLRFHYAIDLVAGVMLAWLVETIAPVLARIGERA